eukprot:TRINITY_DN890_c0_g2_i2.p1 TRINITY_DN890_c0_g2~~TRINITY_DN890_c0_g2_i2.p1  ORF type:complete len:322 (+),score=40.27 TRINITY_DN890_c0_g2_i2:91-966(+)
MADRKQLVNGNVFQVQKSDEVYPELVKAVMPRWSLGYFAAVLLGSVLSTFNSALNSASTLFALEIYKIHISPDASETRIVRVSVIFGLLLASASLIIAPLFEGVDSIFDFMQHVKTPVRLPAVIVFLVGVLTRLPDAFAARVGLLVGAVTYTGTIPLENKIHYLHIMFLCFLVAVLSMMVATYVKPMRRLFRMESEPKPWEPESNGARQLLDVRPWKYLRHMCGFIVLLLILLLSSLQFASKILLLVFGFLWIVVTALLLILPSVGQDNSSSQDQQQDFQEADNEMEMECS